MILYENLTKTKSEVTVNVYDIFHEVICGPSLKRGNGKAENLNFVSKSFFYRN